MPEEMMEKSDASDADYYHVVGTLGGCLLYTSRPAISTNSTMAGVFLFVCQISASLSRRLSGTATMPLFGSMVQKG